METAIEDDDEWALCTPCLWQDQPELAYRRVGAENTPVCKWHYFRGLNALRKDHNEENL